jgi:hypothetical protein
LTVVINEARKNNGDKGTEINRMVMAKSLQEMFGDNKWGCKILCALIQDNTEE